MNLRAGDVDMTSGRSQRIEFGERIRSLRRERNWTLEQLGQRSRIGFSTISKAERGLISLTYDNILKLAFAFDMDMSELLATKPRADLTDMVTVDRKGGTQRIENDYYIMNMLCSRRAKKQMMPVFATIKAHDITEFSKLISHPGEEFVYVLDGQLTLQFEGQAPRVLEPGDSVYFDSGLGHAYLSTGEKAADVLVVCWHPTSHEIEDAGLRRRIM